MTAPTKKVRHSGESRNPASLSGGEQREPLEVREGPVTPYLAKPQQIRHSGESRNPGTWEKTTLGKALPIKYGKSKSADYGLPSEEIPVYGSSGIIGTFNRTLTSGPTLIVGRKGSAGAPPVST